jgi:hypothetical protein
VALSAQLVPNGLAIEVEDRGLGMTPETIDEANERLASPPDFDPQHSSRLGLFVVAKLAERQGIQVVLRRSAYGGVTAVTLIPSELVVAPASTRAEAIEGAIVPGAINDRPAAATRVMALAGAPAAAPPKPHDTRSASGRTADGLPIRIRQATVARALPDARDDTAEQAAAPSRTPEQMRTMLASFQTGMNMGRKAATNDANGKPAAQTPEPGTGSSSVDATELQSTVDDGETSTPKGGGDDDN